MTFSYDLDTSVGQVRLEIGDDDDSPDAGVKPNGTNFSDEEITSILDSEGGVVLRAAARFCELLARRYVLVAESVKIRDYSIDATKKADYWRELAAELRARAGGAFAGGSAATVRVDGYSDDIDSQETAASGSEYWRARPVIRWE
jgi:hypothetical protein